MKKESCPFSSKLAMVEFLGISKINLIRDPGLEVLLVLHNVESDEQEVEEVVQWEE